VIRVMRT